ncbi:helix-turn-helix domain-containing protein [Bacillus sp. EAC]|uniref:helix-turn-helix domain-containing protein n=1 Tax=Bacillus sp. EAC TaxID=1978338 RepID=UPI000B45336D|nr:helix-turn-helix domain-containing protein [Bacillus sp. EAC]
MTKYLLPISIFILSIALFFCGYQLNAYSKIKTKSNITLSNNNKGLLTTKQAAAYLNMTVDELNKMIEEQDLERLQNTVFQTYMFIPYISINNQNYFNQKQLDEWINYNSTTWKYIDTN